MYPLWRTHRSPPLLMATGVRTGQRDEVRMILRQKGRRMSLDDIMEELHYRSLYPSRESVRDSLRRAEDIFLVGRNTWLLHQN